MAARSWLASAGLCWAAIAFAQAPTLPLTIDERIAACEAAEDAEPARAVALAESVLAELPPQASLQRAAALGCRGWSQAMLSQREDARRDVYALMALLESLPASAQRVKLTRRAGGILHRGGDRVAAIDLYARALADAEAQGLEAERIPLLINLGVLHSEFEEHERARVNYEQALSLMARLDDFRYEAPVRFNMGLTLRGQGKSAEAIPHLERTLELVRSTGMGGPMQEVSVNLALAAARQEVGDRAGAAELMQRVQALGEPLTDVNLQMQLAMVEAGQLSQAGDPAAALARLDAVETAKLGEIQQWNWQLQRVRVLEKLGRFEEASQGLRRAGEMREKYLRHQNHERLASLEAHLRDREQRLEMERLETVADAQQLALAASGRQQWMIVIGAGLLLLMGGIVVFNQRRMNRRLDEASRTDPLTGLSNRRDLAQQLREAASPAAGAVMIFDIDHFKRINDEYGHGVGDEVLVAIGRRLRDCVPAGARLARWGGEEFLLLLVGADLARTRSLVETVHRAMSEPVATSAGDVQCSLSTGFCNLPLPGARGPQAWHWSVQIADSALYLAKRAQRDTWVGYWVTETHADWPPERLGREPGLARSLGLLQPISEKLLAPPLAIAS